MGQNFDVWCFPWFPENSLLCIILRYTVYIMHECKKNNNIILNFIIQKLKSKHTSLKKYTNCKTVYMYSDALCFLYPKHIIWSIGIEISSSDIV